MRVHELLRKVPKEQAFWIGSSPFNSLKGLRKCVERIDDSTFHHHVNEHKNDFYNWVKDVYQHKEMAADILACHSREEFLSCLDSWITKAEKDTREQNILEAVVKRKVKELMEKPLYIPPAEVPLDPLKNYMKTQPAKITVNKENLSPMYKISMKPSPEQLAKMRAHEESEKAMKNSVKQLFQRQKYHPKNIPSVVPVPKLWELKPVKKYERKLSVPTSTVRSNPVMRDPVPTIQSLTRRPKVSVKRENVSPVPRPKYHVKTRPVVKPKLKQEVKVSHFPSATSSMKGLLVHHAPDAKSEVQRIQDLKRAQRTSREVTAQSPAEIIGHVKEVFGFGN